MGVTFMTVLVVFDGYDSSGEHLVLLLFVLQKKRQRGNCEGVDGFGGFGSFGHDGYPLKTHPPRPPYFPTVGGRTEAKLPGWVSTLHRSRHD